MKHQLQGLILVSSIGLNIYFIVDKNSNAKQVVDKVSQKESAIQVKKSYIPKKRHENNIEVIEDEIMPRKENSTESTQQLETENEASDENRLGLSEDTFQKAQKRWNQETRSYMERDLGMSPEVADFYFEISKKRQQEIDNYLGPKMDPSMNDEPYMFSIDDNINIAKINEKYLNLLKSAMGRQNYQQYKKYRTRQNRKMMEEGQGYFWIEF